MIESPVIAVSRRRGIEEALAVSAAMVLFAICAHQTWPTNVLGVAGLLLAGVVVARSLFEAEDPTTLLGFAVRSRQTLLYSLVGGGLGAGCAGLHRAEMGMSLLPAGRGEVFAVVACLIGATEELVYRGWLQGRLRGLGRPVAVVAAALAHAAYKTSLFAWPPENYASDLWVLGCWTFAGGVIFGLLREISRSVVPPVVAHAVFDLVVYGAVARAPWWVWD